MSTARPFITPGSHGFLVLAHRLREEVQFDIETFVSWHAADEWCRKHKIKAEYEIGGSRISQLGLSLLQEIATGGRSFATLAISLETTVGALRRVAKALERGGAVRQHLPKGGKKAAQWVVEMTEEGRSVVKLFAS